MNLLNAWGRFVRLFKRTMPAPVISVAERVYLASTALQPMYWLDRWKLVGPDTLYSKVDSSEHRAGEAIVKENAGAIVDVFAPDSVIDFGCGTANYLYHLSQHGCEVYGVEGSSAAIEKSLIPASKIDKADLREPYDPPYQFDLALCTAVIEHIPAVHDKKLINSLRRAAPTVIFSTPPPGTAGEHHVNLHSKEHWISRFESVGLTYDRDATVELHKVIPHTDDNTEPVLWVFRRSDS